MKLHLQLSSKNIITNFRICTLNHDSLLNLVVINAHWSHVTTYDSLLTTHRSCVSVLLLSMARNELIRNPHKVPKGAQYQHFNPCISTCGNCHPPPWHVSNRSLTPPLQPKTSICGLQHIMNLSWMKLRHWRTMCGQTLRSWVFRKKGDEGHNMCVNCCWIHGWITNVFFMPFGNNEDFIFFYTNGVSFFYTIMVYKTSENLHI